MHDKRRRCCAMSVACVLMATFGLQALGVLPKALRADASRGIGPDATRNQDEGIPDISLMAPDRAASLADSSLLRKRTATPTPTYTPTYAPGPSPTPTITTTPSFTPSPSPSPSATLSPTAGPSPTATSSPSPTPTSTMEAPSPTPSGSPSPVRISVAVNDRQDPCYVGWKVGYDIQVANIGGVAAINLVVTDLIPGETYPLLEESTPGAIFDRAQGAVVWEIEPLEAGEVRYLALVLGIRSTMPPVTVITNTVRVSADQASAVSASEETTILAPVTGVPTFTPAPTVSPTDTPWASATPQATLTLTPTPSVTRARVVHLPLILK